MSEELAPIFGRFKDEWERGDRELARGIAREYIRENYAYFQAKLGRLRVTDLVALVETYRAKGDETNRIAVDMWLLIKTSMPGATPPAWGGPIPQWVGELPRWAEAQIFTEHWENGDRESARASAKYFVAERSDDLAPLRQYTIEQLVGLVDVLRDTGLDYERLIVDIWLAAEYEPQMIRGAFDTDGMIRALGGQLRGENFG
jgi:hypothetical protein